METNSWTNERKVRVVRDGPERGRVPRKETVLEVQDQSAAVSERDLPQSVHFVVSLCGRTWPVA